MHCQQYIFCYANGSNATIDLRVNEKIRLPLDDAAKRRNTTNFFHFQPRFGFDTWLEPQRGHGTLLRYYIH